MTYLSDAQGPSTQGPLRAGVCRGGSASLQAIGGPDVDDVAGLTLLHGPAQVLDEPLGS